jgi:hypothetical protein
MSSNSKLNDLQKYELREMKTGFGYENGVIAQVEGATIVLTRTGETSGKFSVSMASLDEKKIRRKVGEFHALSRWMNGDELPCRLASKERVAEYGFAKDADYLMQRAQEIAATLAVE